MLFICVGSMIINLKYVDFSSTDKIYLAVLFGISITCSCISVVIYALNIRRFKSEHVKFPLKKNRAVFVVNQFVLCATWQSLMLVQIHALDYFRQNDKRYVILLIFTYIITVLFYWWSFMTIALYYFSARYNDAERYKRKVKILYSATFVALMSSLIVVTTLLIIHFQENGDYCKKYINSKYPFWLINCLQIFILLMGILAFAYVVYVRVKQLNQTGIPGKRVVMLLKESYLQNNLASILILLPIALCDMLYSTERLSSSAYVYVYGFFHFLWVGFFLIIFYDFDFC